MIQCCWMEVSSPQSSDTDWCERRSPKAVGVQAGWAASGHRGHKWALGPFPRRGCSPPRSGSAPLSYGPFWNRDRSANVCFSCFLAYLDSVSSSCSPVCFSPSLLAVLRRLWLMAQGLLGDRSCVSHGTGAAPRAPCASQPPSANTAGGPPALLSVL